MRISHDSSEHYFNNFALSESAKKANDFKKAKDIINYYDYNHPVSPEKAKRGVENMELYNGRWPELKNSKSGYEILGPGGSVLNMSTDELRHYPVLDKVAKAIEGDIIFRPLIPVIRDQSYAAQTLRNKKRVDRIRGYFNQRYIQPLEQKITQEYMQSMGITDPFSLGIEEQQQMQADIAARVKEQTPVSILKALERENTPEEIIARKFLEDVLTNERVKDKFDMGGRFAITMGEEYYRLGVLNDLPFMESLKPHHLTWGGSENVEFVEEGLFAKYDQYLTLEDLVARYGKYELTPNKIKKLVNLFSPIPGYHNPLWKDNPRERKLLDTLADNPELNANLDIRSRQGQEDLKRLYQEIGTKHRHGFGIKETFVTWRWTRKLKVVTRIVNNEPKVFVRDEHYEKNISRGDISVKTIIAPQTWQGTKLADLEDFFVDVKPCDYQYTNSSDPFKANLAIYGCKYNTSQNIVDNVSLVDLGKPWQFRYNVAHKKLEEYEATDFGKILLANVGSIPDGWSLAEWWNSVTKGKLALVQQHAEGMNNADLQAVRSIDMSQVRDMSATIELLRYYESEIFTSMFYNKQKLGQISPYSTNQNINAAEGAADRQLGVFYNRHRQVKERVLNALLNITLYAYRDNEEKKELLLDEFGKAAYDLNLEHLTASDLALYVVDDFRENQKLEQMRQLALTLLQNGLSPTIIAKAIKADSMAEIESIMEEFEREQAKAGQQKFAQDKEMEQVKAQQLQDLEKMRQDYLAQQEQRANEVKIRLAEINSELLAKANDINENKINDSLERTLVQIESKEKIESDKLELEREKLKNSRG